MFNHGIPNIHTLKTHLSLAKQELAEVQNRVNTLKSLIRTFENDPMADIRDVELTEEAGTEPPPYSETLPSPSNISASVTKYRSDTDAYWRDYSNSLVTFDPYLCVGIGQDTSLKHIRRMYHDALETLSHITDDKEDLFRKSAAYGAWALLHNPIRRFDWDEGRIFGTSFSDFQQFGCLYHYYDGRCHRKERCEMSGRTRLVLTEAA